MESVRGVAAEVLVFTCVGRVGIGGLMETRRGMPILLLVQRYTDLLRGPRPWHHGVPGPPQQGGDGQHHRHVSVCVCWASFHITRE